MTEIYETFQGLLASGSGSTVIDRPEAAVGARYGEWIDADGDRRAGLLPRPEFLLSQIELATTVSGSVSAGDVAMVAVPYELTYTGHVVERALELIGTTLIGVGTSDTICPRARALDLMARYDISVLVSSPSRALELARLEAAKRGPGERHRLRSLVVIGDPCSPRRLARIAELWGARAVTILGTRAMPVVATPCTHGELHLAGEWLSADLRDRSPARYAEYGRRGELLIQPARPLAGGGETTATGELVELWPRDRSCVCGDPSPVVVPLGRVAESLVTAAGPVAAIDVERVLFDQVVALEPDFDCAVRHGQFYVRCAPTRGTTVDHAELARFMHDRLLAELDVDVDVRVTAPGHDQGENR